MPAPGPGSGAGAAPGGARTERWSGGAGVGSIDERVAAWGRGSVSPFVIGPDREVHELPGGGVVGFVRQGRWAVVPGDPVAAPGRSLETLDGALATLDRLRLRPLFVAAVDADPYEQRGLWTEPIADDAVVDLPSFTLVGGRMARLRHSVAAARRAGLTVVPWSAWMATEAAEVSASWLATKRGGEMGFTLGRFEARDLARLDGRVVLDGAGRVIAFATWRPFDGGRSRVLDLMRRAPEAPGSTMDLLIAESLEELRRQGVATASLGSVPRSHGALAERLYPTASLRRFKDKFDPRWEARHLVTPARRHVPAAMVALGRAYSPGGLLAGCRRNR